MGSGSLLYCLLVCETAQPEPACGPRASPRNTRPGGLGGATRLNGRERGGPPRIRKHEITKRTQFIWSNTKSQAIMNKLLVIIFGATPIWVRLASFLGPPGGYRSGPDTRSAPKLRIFPAGHPKGRWTGRRRSDSLVLLPPLTVASSPMNFHSSGQAILPSEYLSLPAGRPAADGLNSLWKQICGATGCCIVRETNQSRCQGTESPQQNQKYKS